MRLIPFSARHFIVRMIGALLLNLCALLPSAAVFHQNSTPATEEQLALAVLAAPSDEQRQALVQAQPQLINLRFRHALAMQILRLQMKGEHPRVLTALEFARQLAIRRGDKGWVAMTWIDSVGSYNLSGQPFKTLAALHQLPPLETLAHDPQALAHVLGVRAFLAREQGKNSVALQDGLRSLQLFAPEQKLEIALAHSVLGMVHVRDVESTKAIEYLNTSLRMFEELGDPLWIVIPLNYLGEHYHYRGDELRAVEYLQRSAALNEKLGLGFLRYYTYNLLGEAYARLGDSSQSLLYYERGLAERETLGNKRLISKALKDLGTFYRAQENYGKALEYLERSLQLADSSQYHEMASIVHRQIGLVWLELGEATAALGSFQHALAEAQAELIPDEIGMSWLEIGRAHVQLGQTAQALVAWQQILAMPDHPGAQNYRGEVLNSIGAWQLSQNNLTAAEQNFRQCLAGLKEAYRLGHHHTALAGLGAVHFARAEYEKSLSFYEQALELSEKIFPEAAARYLARIGELQQRTNQNEKALLSFRKAIELDEALRVRISNPEWRSWYFARQRNHYELYIGLLMQLHQQQPTAGYQVTAFEISERARARSLLETLTEARADIRGGVDPALLARESNLKLKLNARAAQQAAPLNNKQLPAAQLAREIGILTTELQQVEAQIRAKSPRYAALTQPQPLGAAAIQKQVLDANTVLLEYELGKQQSWLFVVTPQTLHAYVLPPRAEIEAATRRLYELLTQRARTAETERQLQAQAQTVSQLLLSPAAAELGQKRLAIVAAGTLQYLPFAALPEPHTSNQPLLQQHELVSLPSASTLAVLRREAAARPPAAKTVAVLADPVFAANDPRVRPQTEAMMREPKPMRTATVVTGTAPNAPRQGWPTQPKRLFYSREEAEAIYATTPLGFGFKALDFRASRATAMQSELSQYRIVHFATHGVLDNEHPELSGLIFSLVDEKGQPQDGFFRLHEIYNLRLNADLVVLSACQTGLGKQVQGEGLIGLTRGFMYAGTARVVASLWEVDDLATADLMKRFYRGMLRDHQTAAAALRTAQLELAQQKRWPAPFYWAAFTIQGEWN